MCNWLIMLDSIFQMFAVLPFLANLAALLAGQSVIDYRVCLTAEMLATGGSYASFLTILLISVERLLIVLFPLRYYFSGRNPFLNICQKII
jgi:hypothetical protein